MITITELELVLFIAFGVMTAMWFRLRAELYMHKHMTSELLSRIANGSMKVVETDEGFDFKDMKS
jgi:predicted outer membrane lipoprotein